MAISDELRKLVDPNNECCCEHCLSNKCKEWAWEKHSLMLFQTQYFPKVYYGVKDLKTPMEDFISKVPQCDRFSADTEPEAIFKATSYIMEQLKQKD